MAKRFKATEIPAIGKVDKVTQVKEFLKENFEIRVNSFDAQKGYIKSLKAEYPYDIEFSDIYIAMIENGITVSQNFLKVLITSRNHITMFNPIKEYFEKVGGTYTGTSHIDLLCSYLKAHNFGDKEDPDYYQKRLKYIIKKWIVATAACALEKRANDVSLGLINAIEGSGKTSLIQFLVPKELEEYYKLSDKETRGFDMQQEYTRNFIINFDEFVGISKSNAELFKKVQSAEKLTILRQGSSFKGDVPRIASSAFTTNRTQEMGGFLSPQMGYRRFGSIEIDHIDKSYSNVVNVDQIWAEAIMLLNEPGFSYVFDEKDYADFQEYNLRYMVQTSAYALIKEYYEIPESESDGIRKTPTEILQDLRRSRKIPSSASNVTEVTIGAALKAIGFQKRSVWVRGKNNTYPYLVKQLY